MGYVQTFSFQPGTATYAAAWPDLYRDTRTILGKIGEIGISLRGPDGTGQPLLQPEVGIQFNGDVSLGESMDGFHLPAPHHMPGTPKDCRFWRFTKTNALPYDIAVCAVLLRAHLLTPDTFRIGGSGTWDPDWTMPRDIIAELFDIRIEHDPLTDPSEGMAIGPASWIDPRLVENPVIP